MLYIMVDNSEFRPIHPIITDVSMIDDNVDIPTINKISTHPRGSNDSDKQTKNQPSWQRTVFIGIIVVFIVILCIMLFYQLYKHFTAEEQQKSIDDNHRQTKPTNTYQLQKENQPVKTNNGEIHIPDNVNTLDNNFLERYVKKPVSSQPVEVISLQPVEVVSLPPAEVDLLLEEHNKETEVDEHTELKIEEIHDTPVRELNKCTYVIRKRGKKNTVCEKPCVEELCDDHKS